LSGETNRKRLHAKRQSEVGKGNMGNWGKKGYKKTKEEEEGKLCMTRDLSQKPVEEEKKKKKIERLEKGDPGIQRGGS